MAPVFFAVTGSTNKSTSNALLAAMTNILEEISAVKQLEVNAAKRRLPIEELRERISAVPAARDFSTPLSSDSKVSLIAEVKRASPSQGVIREDFDPVLIAQQYAEGGVHCISVLTDEQFFGGHLRYLSEIRAAVKLPALRKEFIIDEYQIDESRAAGADAVLLIAECLDGSQLQDFHDRICALGMTALVEFHDAANLERVIDCGAALIGINNRDLATFETDLTHCLRLRPHIPRDRVVVAESGVHSARDVEALHQAGIDAMLVGESLMRSSDIPAAVRSLLGH